MELPAIKKHEPVMRDQPKLSVRLLIEPRDYVRRAAKGCDSSKVDCLT
jgi:hypothetical protein